MNFDLLTLTSCIRLTFCAKFEGSAFDVFFGIKYFDFLLFLYTCGNDLKGTLEVIIH